jgi:hypothetical protein
LGRSAKKKKNCQNTSIICPFPVSAYFMIKKNKNYIGFEVHESVHRDTIVLMTNKVHYID